MPVMGITDHPSYDNLNNNVMTELQSKVQMGIEKGFSRTPKVQEGTGKMIENNPLNEFMTGAVIDITV